MGWTIGAVAVAAVHDRDLRQPAVHPTFTSRRDKNDIATREISGLDVVIGSLGELLEAAAIGVDFVEVIVFSAAFAISEEDLSSVITHLRIAHAAFGIVEQCSQLTGPEIELVELAAFAVGFAIGVGRVVADVGVPVSVSGRAAGESRGEDNLFDAELLQWVTARRGTEQKR